MEEGLNYIIAFHENGTPYRARVPNGTIMECVDMREEEIYDAIMILSHEVKSRDPEYEHKQKVQEYIMEISKNLPKKPGVYSITCKSTGDVYIGASKNIKQRIKGHITRLSDHKDSIGYFVKKFGIENFEFSVLEIVNDTKKLSEHEEYWFLKFQMSGAGIYNKSKRFIEHGAWRE